MVSLLRIFLLLVAATLSCGAPALALQDPQQTQPPEGEGGGSGAPVTATGVLERPELTTYQYGEYAVADEETGTLYALGSETVDLGAYIGERVTVTGTVVPGYEEGQIEGGPALLEVTSAEVAGGGAGDGAGDGAEGGAGTVTATFRLVIEGALPEDFSFYVEDSQGTGGVICTTDRDVVSEGTYPECRDEGGTNEVSFPVTPGEPFDYRLLASRGVELSQQVVSEDSLSPTEDFTVEATYSIGPGDQYADGGQYGQYADAEDPDSPGDPVPENDAGSGPPENPDLNGDGATDEADGEHAASVSDRGDRATDDEGGPVLPDTGGYLSPVLLAAAGLLGGFLISRLRPRRSR